MFDFALRGQSKHPATDSVNNLREKCDKKHQFLESFSTDLPKNSSRRTVHHWHDGHTYWKCGLGCNLVCFSFYVKCPLIMYWQLKIIFLGIKPPESSRFGFYSHLGLERHNDNKILLRSKVEIAWSHVCRQVFYSPISTSKMELNVQPRWKWIILNPLTLSWCQICFVGDLDLGQTKTSTDRCRRFGMLQLFFISTLSILFFSRLAALELKRPGIFCLMLLHNSFPLFFPPAQAGLWENHMRCPLVKLLGHWPPGSLVWNNNA